MMCIYATSISNIFFFAVSKIKSDFLRQIYNWNKHMYLLKLILAVFVYRKKLN